MNKKLINNQESQFIVKSAGSYNDKTTQANSSREKTNNRIESTNKNKRINNTVES